MKILLINLATSTERLAFQQAQFAKLGLSFDILPAVSVDDISDDEYHRLAFGWQRPLRKVELACFLSHKKAWQTVLEHGKPCLIIEDDAVLVQDLVQLLHDIETAAPVDTDLVNLEVRSRKKIISKRPATSLLDGQCQLYSLYQDRTGTGGYVLFPTGAAKLLDRLQHTAPATADGFIYASYELNSYQTEPAMLIQQDQMQAYGLTDDLRFDSTIGRSEHHAVEYDNLSQKLTFKLRRLWAQLRMGLRHLSVLSKAQRRYIEFDKERFK
ncbi:glycosyltransferase family 25 protein [Moraxella sp. FZFQ2102]|uniref:glycosyltransferase family 25 protein n=1 Tax=Moraxella sp. FZFQ2102 TaxID=2953752 RepID=UPI00209BE2A3|nr:glycosyltransferase family 25 protein [Moraxella sp. FZFQ2102]USZ14927.1 glycosyltransferase family 25 protein [Moraxella sp. FZFQ2102]